jgi:hypothetical protein
MGGLTEINELADQGDSGQLRSLVPRSLRATS